MKCVAGYEIQVLKSGAGWYIGTIGEDGPNCRISVQYFPTKEAAEKALADGMVLVRHCVENEWCASRHGGLDCFVK